METIPALNSEIILKRPQTQKKIASMQEIHVLNKDVNVTEDEKINEMVQVSEEMAEYHHWQEP